VLNLIEEFSHESVRKWYTKCKSLFDVKKRWRRAVAVDETKVKTGEQLYLHLECNRCRWQSYLGGPCIGNKNNSRCNIFFLRGYWKDVKISHSSWWIKVRGMDSL